MNRHEPWCVVQRGPNGYRVKFGAGDNEDFQGRLQSLKDDVDWRDREFDRDTKTWRIKLAAGSDLRRWALRWFEIDQRQFIGGVPGDEERRTTPPPPPRSSKGLDDPYAVLWLRPGAPPELVKAAYRTLAVQHHPDRGGDTAMMQAINAAYEQLGKGAA
jgi:DnaJ-domain-containing protein 1